MAKTHSRALNEMFRFFWGAFFGFCAAANAEPTGDGVSEKKRKILSDSEYSK